MEGARLAHTRTAIVDQMTGSTLPPANRCCYYRMHQRTDFINGSFLFFFELTGEPPQRHQMVRVGLQRAAVTWQLAKSGRRGNVGRERGQSPDVAKS